MATDHHPRRCNVTDRFRRQCVAHFQSAKVSSLANGDNGSIVCRNVDIMANTGSEAAMRTTNGSRAIGVIGTLIVHCLFVLLALLHTAPVGDSPVDDQGREEVLRDRPSDAINVVIVGTTGPSLSSPVKQPCEPGDDTYMGIGLQFWIHTGIVTNAPHQYPAYKAGIREGDILSDVTVKADRDGYITHEVNRLGRTLTFSAKQELICFHR